MNFETSRCATLQYCPDPYIQRWVETWHNFYQNLIGVPVYYECFCYVQRATPPWLWAQWYYYYGLFVDLNWSVGIFSNFLLVHIWVYKVTKFEDNLPMISLKNNHTILRCLKSVICLAQHSLTQEEEISLDRDHQWMISKSK